MRQSDGRSPLTAISLVRNCCTTITRLSYNLFRIQVDIYSFEYRNLMWIWGREEGLYAFSSFFSLSRDKVKNGKIEAVRSQIRANEIRWFWRRINVNACERQTGKLIIYLSFHRCFTIVSIWRTRGRLSCESRRRLMIQ